MPIVGMTDIEEPPPPHETSASVARHPAAPAIPEDRRIETSAGACSAVNAGFRRRGSMPAMPSERERGADDDGRVAAVVDRRGGAAARRGDRSDVEVPAAHD